MFSGNKGEWSEIYALLKILEDRQLTAGDQDMKPLDSVFYPVIQIIRDEINGTQVFSYDDTNIVITKGKDKTYSIPIEEFSGQVKLLLNELVKKKKNAFLIPATENFLKQFETHGLKAKSSKKSDIRITIYDERTGHTPTLGFSIKSQIGSPSTLLNSSQATNFKFELIGNEIGEKEIVEINSINSKSKIRERIKRIHQHGLRLVFSDLEHSVFKSNLELIDSLLPSIIADVVLQYYTGKNSDLEKAIDNITSRNPLNFDLSRGHPHYKYKIKHLLTDCALGMLPATVWNGKLDATGGTIIVKESGDIVCYHIYNRNEFEEYLLQNTKLDTPKSKRNKFGQIYCEGSKYYINLNLQIRFKK